MQLYPGMDKHKDKYHDKEPDNLGKGEIDVAWGDSGWRARFPWWAVRASLRKFRNPSREAAVCRESLPRWEVRAFWWKVLKLNDWEVRALWWKVRKLNDPEQARGFPC